MIIEHSAYISPFLHGVNSFTSNRDLVKGWSWKMFGGDHQSVQSCLCFKAIDHHPPAVINFIHTALNVSQHGWLERQVKL